MQRTRPGSQSAHRAGWWSNESQQASQPVSSSQLLQDEQLAQKLQREEESRRQGSQRPNPTGYIDSGYHPGGNNWGYPPQDAQPPLNLWHPPPAQTTPQQNYPPQQNFPHQQQQGYPPHQQGYPPNSQNTWWSGGPTDTGYPQVCNAPVLVLFRLLLPCIPIFL